MRVDTDRIKRDTDLLALIGRDTELRRVATTGGGEYAGPCPFCGGNDRLRVQPNTDRGGQWFCRQCTGEPGDGGRWHDAISYVMKRHSLDFLPACQRLAGPAALPKTSRGVRTKSQRKPAVNTGIAPPSREWQRAARAAVNEAHKQLMIGCGWIRENPIQAHQNTKSYWRCAPAAARAYKSLQSRGLLKHTIVAAQLGFNPEWKEVLPGHRLAPGITIPTFAAGQLWCVNVRTTKQVYQRTGNKYMAMTGSTKKSLYQADDLLAARYGVEVEGELDALLLKQEAGDLIGVTTMGSAKSLPHRWRVYFGHLAGLFVFKDQDETGKQGQAGWIKWARPMPPGPAEGQDITDYFLAGGDLRQWVMEALASTPEARSKAQLEEYIRMTSAGDPGWLPAVEEYCALRRSESAMPIVGNYMLVNRRWDGAWDLWYQPTQRFVAEIDPQQAADILAGNLDPEHVARRTEIP